MSENDYIIYGDIKTTPYDLERENNIVYGDTKTIPYNINKIMDYHFNQEQKKIDKLFKELLGKNERYKMSENIKDIRIKDLENTVNRLQAELIEKTNFQFKLMEQLNQITRCETCEGKGKTYQEIMGEATKSGGYISLNGLANCPDCDGRDFKWNGSVE